MQASTWILSIAATFVFTPPIWNINEDVIWNRFAHFVVAAIVGLSLFPISIWSKRKHRLKIWLITVSCLVLSIVTFFYYQSLRAAWTIDYDAKRVIIGGTYTPDALSYKARVFDQEHRVINDQELLMNYGSDLSAVWVEEEIRQRRLVFAAIYVALISLLAISIIGLIEVV